MTEKTYRPPVLDYVVGLIALAAILAVTTAAYAGLHRLTEWLGWL